MNKLWHDKAWAEYSEWQTRDKKTLKRINLILKSIERDGYSCLGKPEPLKGNLSPLRFPLRFIYSPAQSHCRRGCWFQRKDTELCLAVQNVQKRAEEGRRSTVQHLVQIGDDVETIGLMSDLSGNSSLSLMATPSYCNSNTFVL